MDPHGLSWDAWGAPPVSARAFNQRLGVSALVFPPSARGGPLRALGVWGFYLGFHRAQSLTRNADQTARNRR